jgi:endonuclease III
MNKKLPIIFTYLKELFPNPETELHYSTPFQFVVAVMLSAQATDVQVNKVTEKLFKKIKNPEDLLAIGFPSFKKAVNSINYYQTKAKHIRETAKLLKQRKKIPSNLDKLMELPGVGVKTGKLIAHVLYDKPFIAVDTHIHRVSNRL